MVDTMAVHTIPAGVQVAREHSYHCTGGMQHCQDLAQQKGNKETVTAPICPCTHRTIMRWHISVSRHTNRLQHNTIPRFF